jgi:hypothetical protein
MYEKAHLAICFRAGILPGFLDPEGESDIFLRNVGLFLKSYTVLYIPEDSTSRHETFLFQCDSVRENQLSALCNAGELAIARPSRSKTGL